MNNHLSSIIASVFKQTELSSEKSVENLAKSWHNSSFRPSALSAQTVQTLLHLIAAGNLFAKSQKVSFHFEQISQNEKIYTEVCLATQNLDHTTATITGCLQHLGFVISDLHPAVVIPIIDSHQNITHFEPFDDTATAENAKAILLFSFRLEGYVSPKKQKDITEHISSSLRHNAQVAKDKRQMVAILGEIEAQFQQSEQTEEVAFLHWLNSSHFHLLGSRKIVAKKEEQGFSYHINSSSKKGLFYRKNFQIFRGLFVQEQQEIVQDIIGKHKTISVSKASTVSPVIEPRNLDVISIKAGEDNNCVIYQICGLFSHAGYLSSAFDLPIVRRRCEKVVKTLSDGKPKSFQTKIRNTIDLYPRDEIYQSDSTQILEAISYDISAQNSLESNMYIREDPFRRYSSVMVNFPRTLYRKELAEQIGDWLAEKHHSIFQTHYTFMPDKPMWRLQIILRHVEGSLTHIDNTPALQAELQDKLLSWHNKLVRQLFMEGVPCYKDSIDNWLELDNDNIFLEEYKKQHLVENALYDVKKLIHLDKELDIALLHNAESTTSSHLYHLKIYTENEAIPLHQMTPVLNNMGIEIISEIPYTASLDGKTSTHTIHDFTFRHQLGSVSFDSLRNNFENTCLAALRGLIPNDVFNKLSLTVGLDSRSIDLLRAYSWYMKQITISYTASTTVLALAHYPRITELLISLFYTRFDPSLKMSMKKRKDEVKQICATIEDSLVEVSNANEDAIFRHYLNLICATLRTNFFQPAGDVITLKFDAQLVQGIPEPKPLREIFVHAKEFQACHLRFGQVARGGLRFSDRTEDLRTEILGLAKAQQVKNAVIVPLGAKGGFVLKNPPSDRNTYLEKGVACYRRFIGAMLDITDNRVGEKIIHPSHVIRYDEDDPYLVVAADKGTATFSDYANEIAVEKGFWLQDAFASGGSNGYDHKKMGITARGAWESVKRHFREREHDTQSQPFDVVGIGDMSGDVFGNGMLLSEKIRLIAAFNHLHIFIDPEPDCDISFKERKRLFTTPYTTWKDYNAQYISKGGGIFERAKKTLTISKEIMQRFDIPTKVLTPNALIGYILKSQTDLLWFGGIGTYIKASTETHAQASDRTNDTIRIDASDVRAKVIGEGANLGMTQKARIEFALNGGKCNTDAIDNSAGVDCSDHEVNIKILLNEKVSNEEISFKERNQILKKMTKNVAQLVLSHNIRQNDALAFALQHAHSNLPTHAEMMTKLESEGFLNRAIEFLPDEQEIERRQSMGLGLTSPELSVLLAYDKNYIYKNLLDSDVPDDPELTSMLKRYFPDYMQKNFANHIFHHPLKREIIATAVTNYVVDNTGLGFILETKNETDKPLHEIVRSILIAHNITGVGELWQELERVKGSLKTADYLRGKLETFNTIKRCTGWLLDFESDLSSIKTVQQKYLPTAQVLRKAIPHQIPQEAKRLTLERIEKFAQSDFSPKLSSSLGSLKFLSCLFDIAIIDIASPQHSTKSIIETYFMVSQLLGLDWMRTSANALTPLDRWQQSAIQIAIGHTWKIQSQITEKLIAANRTGNHAIQFLEKECSVVLQHTLAYKKKIMVTNRVSISSLNVYNDSLRFLCQHI